MARTLGQLAREGIVYDQPDLPATGFWAYNGTVGYWSPIPGLASIDHTTRAAWATVRGLTPVHWDLP